MGNMSFYRRPGVKIPRRATEQNRNLTGQRLLDVLTVIRTREGFNRACRRLVFSRWRKHCRANRAGLTEGLKKFKGLVLPNDHPAFVQQRLLAKM